MTPGVERRSYPRFTRKDIRVTLLDPLDQVIDAKTVLGDISQGGAALTTRSKLLPGESVKFHVHMPGGRTASGHGKVRWIAEERTSFSRQVGIEFLDFGWGGFGKLQEELAGGAPSFAPTSEAGVLDALLLGACAAVVFLIYRASAAHPSSLDGSLPVWLIAASAAGLALLKR
ncbi:MAG: PilZ domain-containing protein [Elusimicrobia bacterium]|nr:PilZ domain-containing protein [Elusimicrobiota bacterium]